VYTAALGSLSFLLRLLVDVEAILHLFFRFCIWFVTTSWAAGRRLLLQYKKTQSVIYIYDTRQNTK
jgi:hypothetical protein